MFGLELVLNFHIFNFDLRSTLLIQMNVNFSSELIPEIGDMGIRYKKTLGLLRVLSKLKHVTIRLVTTTIVTILSKRNQLDKTNSNQFKQIQTNYISNLSEDISPCAHSGARCSVSESV